MSSSKFLIGFIYTFLIVKGQEALTLERAIAMALENNYTVQIANMERAIADKDVTLGNAGFLPTLNLAIGNTLASTNVHQELFSGTVIDRSGARQNNLNSNLILNWVVFDGFRRTHMYERLKAMYEKADYETRLQMEGIVWDVSSAYYQLTQQLEIKDAYEATLRLYEDRLRLAEARLATGLGAKGDVLLTKVDINAQRSLLLRQHTLIDEARFGLNRTLNRDVKTDFTVEKAVRMPSLDSSTSYTGQNVSLAASKTDIKIAERYARETRSLFFPRVNVLSAYNFTQVQSQAGQLLLNRNGGPSVGFGLNWSIFDGFNKSRAYTASHLRVKISELIYRDQEYAQALAYERALSQYKNALKIFAIETESHGLAMESNELAKQRYLSGSIHLFEYKETQKMLEDAHVRLANARYDALSAEVVLKRLNGSLLN